MLSKNLPQNVVVFSTWITLLFVITGCQPNESNKSAIPEQNVRGSWQNLTVREKAGQLVCYCYNPYQMNQYGKGSVDTFLAKYPVGSIFMASWQLPGNLPADSLKQHYLKTVMDLNKASKYPMLFAEDFESGMGSLIPGYTNLPGEMALGAIHSKESARIYASIIARQARSLGINWLLNPVADINLNPYNYLTNVRATGDKVDRAIEVLPTQMKSMQMMQVAATAKHFPGDGTDFTNQHFCVTRMKLSVDEWQQQHGLIFKTLIDSGVMAIMAGHISFPAYQKKLSDAGYLPATLSDELMIDLLKNKMGFKGVVVTDALNMGGVTGYFPNQLETEIACFVAGADVLLWPSLEVIDSIEARVNRGVIPMERLNDAVSRVWQMKQKLGLFDPNYQLIKPISDLELKKDNELAYQLACKSITVLNNKNKMMPMDTVSSKNVLVLYIAENDLTKSLGDFTQGLIQKGFHVEVMQNLNFFAHSGELVSLAARFDKILVVFCNNPGNPYGSLQLRGEQSMSVWSANCLPLNKVISIGIGDPYKNFMEMPRTWCRINAYNSDDNTLKALVEVLTGTITATATSPVQFE